MSCAAAFERLGFPEGNYPLAEACLYLATAPKSNSAMAFFDALAAVEKEDAEVPAHLRDPSRDKEAFGHGAAYVYPHAYREHWRAQQYLPSSLQGQLFYTPSRMGYENMIREEVLRKREIQAASLLGGNQYEDLLSWSPRSKGVDTWVRRLESGRNKLLLSSRDVMMDEAAPRREGRILVLKADDGLLLWEGLRRVPEGLCAGCVSSEDARDTLIRLSAGAGLEEIELPRIAVSSGAGVPTREEAERAFDCASFDSILVREPWRAARVSGTEITELALAVRELLDPRGVFVLLASPPALGGRLSRLLKADLNASSALIKALEDAEEEFFLSGGTEKVCWDAETVNNCFGAAGLRLKTRVLEQQEERLLTERDILAWFNTGKSSWGRAVYDFIGEDPFNKVKNLLIGRVKQGPVLWNWKSLLFHCVPG
jgi:putative ATPase